MATDLCALADVRKILETPTADTGRDTLITELITHASGVIMGELEREIVTTATNPTSRTFEFDPDARNRRGTLVIDLAPYDAQTITTVTLNPEESATVLTSGTDYKAAPMLQPEGVYTSLRLSRYLVSVSQLQLRFGVAQIAVAGAWGWPSVPTDVKDTCAHVVSAWMDRAIPNLNLGIGEMENLPPAIMASLDLPLFARRNLNRYRRNLGAL